MTRPVRIMLQRTAGWRLAEQSPDGREIVVVTRSTRWGNPWRIWGGEWPMPYEVWPTRTHDWKVCNEENGVGTPIGCASTARLARAMAVHHFAEQLADLVRLGRYPDPAALRGRHLACWCAPDYPCHADVLLLAANDGLEASGPFELTEATCFALAGAAAMKGDRTGRPRCR